MSPDGDCETWPSLAIRVLALIPSHAFESVRISSATIFFEIKRRAGGDCEGRAGCARRPHIFISASSRARRDVELLPAAITQNVRSKAIGCHEDLGSSRRLLFRMMYWVLTLGKSGSSMILEC